ncbi:unnamed protein product [Polarella glacialis]|uniref:Uncharacterized protein n=1 Tax=Polarella glacialis TaxID=89957 RepID=A0A813IGB9_POLGL|nr:unnamed protein product [Polarella glacialis]
MGDGWGPSGSRRTQVRGSLLALYLMVFFSQFKPSEPFLVDFLVSKGFTNKQVYKNMFPLYVYARLPCMILVGLFSELPCCRGGAAACSRILFAGTVCGFATVMLTLWTEHLEAQQLAQFTVAFNFASRFAVVPMIFALVPAAEYQQHTHLVKAVLLISNAGSALLGEVLRDMASFPLSGLFSVAAVCQAASVLCALALLRAEPSPGPTPSEVVAAQRGIPQLGWATSLKAAMRDLVLCFRLRCVVWWTIWALAMNSSHGLALTYWQNLLRENGIQSNHNGYMLGGTYLAAAGLVAACRRSALLGGLTEALIIPTLLAAGTLLFAVASATQEVPFYSLLTLFQCIFEVVTAVSTFQVGAELTRAADPELARTRSSWPVPKQARLTLLFSATGVLVGLTETSLQVVLGRLHSQQMRFQLLGLGLAALGVLLAVVSCLEGLIGRRSRCPWGAARLLPAAEDSFVTSALRHTEPPSAARALGQGCGVDAEPPPRAEADSSSSLQLGKRAWSSEASGARL